MYKSMKTLVVLSAFAAALAATPMLYAHESQRSRGSMMGHGMMGQMSQMMEGCNKMMQSMNWSGGSGRPNKQWREDEPDTAKRRDKTG